MFPLYRSDVFDQSIPQVRCQNMLFVNTGTAAERHACVVCDRQTDNFASNEMECLALEGAPRMTSAEFPILRGLGAIRMRTI